MADLPRQLSKTGGIDRPRMDDALKSVSAAREHFLIALEYTDKNLTDDRHHLNALIGDLASMRQRWITERERWR